MENEPKKISFGFSKLIKKPNLILNKESVKTTENEVQLIDCLEEKSIKVIGGNECVIKGPLVIPMKQPNKKLVNLVDLVKNNFVETIEENGNVQIATNKIENKINISQLSLEEQAAFELINASKKDEIKEDNKRIIEIDKDKFVVEGEKESSMDDYEDVPIEEFGKAMLRGMGWKDGCGIGKNEKLVKVLQPAIRPKGMGLGADKMTKQDPSNKPAVDRDGQVLKCVKRAYVKIVGGYHKGSYGQIKGFDDESGRFIIERANDRLNISLNEFLVVPVTKDEYNKISKTIDVTKYEEFMKNKEEERRILEKEKLTKYVLEDESYQKKKSHVKKKRKSESSDAEEGTSKREEPYRRNKNERIKKDQYSDSDSDDEKKRSTKYEEYKRDRKSREKKSKKYSSDVSSNDEDEKKYRKSSKRDEHYTKKKHKKKKAKKHSSDESDDEQYKRKSKKIDKKFCFDSKDGHKRSKSYKGDQKNKSR